MDPKHQFYTLWDQIIDEELQDNTDEEVVRLMLQNQHEVYNTTQHRQRRKVVNWNREEGHDWLFNDYFSPNPVYTRTQFQRRFHMQSHVFLWVVEALNNHDEYFQMRVNTMHRKGLSLLQKCIVDLRILAYGLPVDSVNEYIQIVETTIVECLQRFVSSICAIFGDEYLRRLNN